MTVPEYLFGSKNIDQLEHLAATDVEIASIAEALLTPEMYTLLQWASPNQIGKLLVRLRQQEKRIATLETEAADAKLHLLTRLLRAGAKLPESADLPAIAEAYEVTSFARWIPVAKRLPTEWKEGKTVSNTIVMLTAQDEEVLGYYSISSGWWDNHGEPVEDVMHWLELPLTERERVWRGYD